MNLMLYVCSVKIAVLKVYFQFLFCAKKLIKNKNYEKQIYYVDNYLNNTIRCRISTVRHTLFRWVYARIREVITPTISSSV